MKATKILVLLAMMIVCAGAVMAAAAFDTPGASATISGATYVVNVTSAMDNLENCTVSASSTLTGDSLAGTVFTNESADADFVNATIDTTALEDATDWAFTAECYNTTGDNENASRTGVTVDNTAPTTPTSLSPTTGTDKTANSFSATVTGAQTTACTLTYWSTIQPSTTAAMTHSGNTCTHSLTLPNADWQYTVTASDGTNTSLSATTNLKISSEGSGGGGGGTRAVTAEKASVVDALQSGEPLSKNNKTKIFVVIGAVVLIGLHQGWFGKKKGAAKRKRKR
jgi:hypothetical protein